MNLLKKLFSKPHVEINEIYRETAELQKKATQAKENDDYEKAVSYCKQAILLINNSNERIETIYSNTLELYFKMARYLHESGKKEEAWGILKERLALVKLSFIDNLVPMNQMKIFAEMRKLSVKENNYYNALVYYFAEATSWNKGLAMQDRIKELPTLPLETVDLPKYITTYCKRLDFKLVPENVAIIISDIWQDYGNYRRVDLDKAMERFKKRINQYHTR